jgi:hypothetical protein
VERAMKGEDTGAETATPGRHRSIGFVLRGLVGSEALLGRKSTVAPCGLQPEVERSGSGKGRGTPCRAARPDGACAMKAEEQRLGRHRPMGSCCVDGR